MRSLWRLRMVSPLLALQAGDNGVTRARGELQRRGAGHAIDNAAVQ